MTPTVQQFLKSPKIIVGELAALALLCALGAAIPQQGTATSEEMESLRHAGTLVMGGVDAFGLDHVFRNPLFFSVAALISASLIVVILGQLKRLRLQWSQQLTEAHFQSAPFRSELEVDASMGRAFGSSGNSEADGARVKIWTERHIGLLGSPIFHIGLLLLIVAGVLRTLFATSAVVDIMEGETLAPVASAWGGQFPGTLGKPFQLDCPVTLQTVKAAHYKDGDLRDLKVALSLSPAGKPDTAELAVNHDLKIGGARLFLGSDFGPAALVEWQSVGGAPRREAVLLTKQGANDFEGSFTGPLSEVAYLRARMGIDGMRPSAVELRVMKGGVLLFTGDVEVGRAVMLPGGGKLLLHGLPFWARFHGSRDAALWLAYAGFALVMAGAALIFTVVKADFCIVVKPLNNGRWRVFVAVKPQRLAPLFRERFESLIRQQQAVAEGLLKESKSPVACRMPAGPLPGIALSRAVTSLLLVLGAGMLSGCDKFSTDQARQLVERYNQVVSEAYRRGDARLADAVVGPNEGKKLTGLIGVRLDEGMTLDSQLVSLEVTGVEKTGDQMFVRTREHWKYRDHKIGTGEQVGEESNDNYEMLYLIKKIDQAWVVDEIRFTSEPQVSRKKLPFPNERLTASHGQSASPQPEGRQP